jgi:toxin ParE1/3/4
MARFGVSAIAGRRLDQIFGYTRNAWGQAQADAYIRGLFDCFDRIARHEQAWRAIPAQFGVDGYYCRYEHHFIYWRQLGDGAVGIVTILHERMHQIDCFREDSDA